VTLEDLVKTIDVLGWDEFFEVRSRDDHPERPAAGPPSAPPRLKAIGAEIDPHLLLELSQTPGYLVWSLRLCPHVSGANCAALAREHSDSDDHTVRYWARRLLST
jgi:hypothetical protein